MIEMGCEGCGNDIATVWAYDMALCTDCAEEYDEVEAAAAAQLVEETKA